MKVMAGEIEESIATLPKKTNLFAVAPVAPAKKSTEKVTVNVPSLAKAIQTFNDCKEQLDALEARKADAESMIHEAGRKAFLDLYRQNRKNPDSFYLAANGARVMYIPMDKYKSIDAERAAYLTNTLGESFVTATTEYSFDSVLIEKYAVEISAAIMNSKKIAEQDKPNLIVSKTKLSVAKGSIDRLLETHAPATTLAEIGVIVSLKRA